MVFVAAAVGHHLVGNMTTQSIFIDHDDIVLFRGAARRNSDIHAGGNDVPAELDSGSVIPGGNADLSELVGDDDLPWEDHDLK